MQQYNLCFNDILLLPHYSKLDSRTIPNTTTRIGSLELKTPIISAPMDSITGKEMLVTMSKVGGLGILTRYINMPDDEELVRQVQEIVWAKKQGAKNVGCAIGIRGSIMQKIKAKSLLDAGCNVICIDVGHGDHQKMYRTIDAISILKNQYQFVLMAGNICTSEAAIRFANYGVDAIKVGVGPGSCCITRTTTGFGRPQLSAVQDAYLSVRDRFPKISIICDGGIRSTGDMIKSFWAGADAVMLGYMLAGTSDTPKINGQRIIRGMSSRTVSGRPDIAPEGIEIEIEDRGETEKVLYEYMKGIKAGLAMGGSKNIAELRENVTHVTVSPLSMEETMPKTC